MLDTRKTLAIALALAALAGGAAAAYATVNATTRDDAAPPTAGAWPTIDDALHALERHGPILLHAREDFSPANGVRSGSGTAADPYVIADVYAPSITVRDISVAIAIRHAYVSGALVLDWTGPGARVEDSRVGLLETNTNRPHHAPATWIDATNDRIGAVVARHAGGSIRGNVIGPDGPVDADQLSLNVEGYDGLRVENNTVLGPAEFRLHGHHASDSFDDAWMPMDMMGNGTDRYHALVVDGNVFVDPTGRGVDISDRDHAANDRTAKSEPDPALNGTHRHFTRIAFDGNSIQGAGLLIEDANATDPHHEAGGWTDVHVGDLRVTDPLSGVAVRVERAHAGANVTLDGGELRLGARVAGSVGVSLDRLDGANVTLRGTLIQGFDVGVHASHVSKQASWSLLGVRFVDDARATDWDATVRAPPTQREEAPTQG